jgi:hypothetical protein
MLHSFLCENEIPEALIYVDNLLEYGLSIIEKIKSLVNVPDCKVRVIKDPSPDHLIKAVTDGIIASSDSTIIDKTALPIFDVPGYIIKKSFHKEISNILDL